MKLTLAIGALLFALACGLVISAVQAGLERSGTSDEAAHVVRVTTDGAGRGFANLWP
jgi:hypothetical protein